MIDIFQNNSFRANNLAHFPNEIKKIFPTTIFVNIFKYGNIFTFTIDIFLNNSFKVKNFAHFPNKIKKDFSYNNIVNIFKYGKFLLS